MIKVDAARTAHRIMDLMTRHQRRAKGPDACRTTPCTACAAVHAARVARAVEAGEPVRFVLPAFPGKSPNRAKVLGVLPDTAERLALEFLDALTARVREVYEPGARILICSDGRVFSDAVGIPDEHITAYQRELRAMIETQPHGGLELFNLEDVPELAGTDHDLMRALLTKWYAEPLESLRRRIRAGEEVDLYRAITRFLFEDADTDGHRDSRSALQRDARARAYTVIQRSKAWGDLLADCFPGTVRLSIHPQPCGSAKLGINLVETSDNWLTPWHSVALHDGERFTLTKRRDAEALGAQLVHREGRPAHYRLGRATTA